MKSQFYLVPGDARGLAYVNEAPLLTPQLLRAYDRITVGRTKLLFLPFCGEKFQWKEEQPGPSAHAARA
jgi:hypothetical protein